jgi:hypothetical protein
MKKSKNRAVRLKLPAFTSVVCGAFGKIFNAVKLGVTW